MNILYLQNINQVRVSLNIWLSNVEQLHFGNQGFANANGLDRKNTEFSKWYFGEGQSFKKFETFNNLLFFYDEMFNNFLAYFQLYNTPLKKGIFSKNVKKRQNELNNNFQKLKQNARKLFKSFELFEEEIKSSLQFENYSPTNWFQIENIEVSDIVYIESIKTMEKSSDKLPPEYEKKLQEEVLKIKKQLEAEYAEKLDLLKKSKK